jgi:hypothetical protein
MANKIDKVPKVLQKSVGSAGDMRQPKAKGVQKQAES